MRLESAISRNLNDIRLQKIYTITGQLSLVAVFVCVFYGVVFFAIHIPLLAWFCTGISILALVSRLAWHRGYIHYARFSLIILGNALIFVLCGSLGRQSGINFLYFPISSAILVLYNLRNLTFIVLSMCITLGCLIILEIYSYSIFPISMPDAPFINTMRVLSIFVAILVEMVCVFSMQFAADKAEKTLSEAKEELKNYSRKMELKNQELEQFTFIASHDLNEPLRTVTSFVDLLTESYGDAFDDTAKSSFRYISEAVTRMKGLLIGLLEYGRIGQDGSVSEINTNALISMVCKDLDFAIKSSGARISIAELPKITGYETELRLLFQNLISNAIKFRNPEKAPEIEVFAEKDETSWVFAVKDNGIGIAPQYQEKIFTIFQRLHKRSEYEGSGIGLAHCKKIVDLHNGRIWLTSETGKGTTFYFTINTIL